MSQPLQQQQQQSNQRVTMLPEIEALERQLNSGADSAIPDIVKGTRHQIVTLQQNTQGLDGFYLVLRKLLDRFFGEMTTGTDSIDNGLDWQRSNDAAGWVADRRYSSELLELFKPPVIIGSSSSSSSGNNGSSKNAHSSNSSSSLSSTSSTINSTSNTISTNGVTTNLTIFKVFSEKNEKGINWLMKVCNFPKKVQFFFRDILMRRYPDEQMESFYPSFYSENHSLLYQRLLTLPVSEQRFMNNKLKADPLDYFFICLVRYACVNTSKEMNLCSQLKNTGMSGWISGSVYLDLLQTWIARLFLTSKESSRSDERSDEFLIGRMFLRLVADFWLGNNLIVKKNFENIAYYNKHKTGVVSQHSRLRNGTALIGDPMVVETMDDGVAVEITDLTMQSIYILLNHLLAKPLLWGEYDQIREGQPVKDAEYDHTKQENKSHRHIYHRLSSDHHRDEYISSSEDVDEGNNAYPAARVCPPNLGILQVPLFDTLRIVFDRVKAVNNIHTYFLAVKVWLLYIQPWTALEPMQAIRQKLKEPVTRGGGYDRKWDSYVSANFHFYTTMLAIFIKSVSVLDLSFLDSGDLDIFYHLFRAVISVFNVDTPLRKFIDKLTAEYRAFARTDFQCLIRSEKAIYIDMGDNRRKHFPEPWGDLNIQRHLFSIFRQHRLIYPDLGLVEPRAYELAGAADFKSLIMEADSIIGAVDPSSGKLVLRGRLIDAFNRAIVTQNNHFGLDQLCALIGLNSLLGFQPFESEVAYQLRACMEQYGTKLIGKNERDWRRLIKLHSRGHVIHAKSDTEFGISEPERMIANGKLTLTGKEQLLRGMRLSKKSIRAFIDPLDLPIMSYEWPWLVRWFSRLSKYVNKKLSLPRDQDAVYKQWTQIFEIRVPISRTDTVELIKRNIDQSRSSFRINLRALAGIRVGSFLMAILALMLHFIGILSVYLLSLILAVLGYAIFDGSNTWLPMPNDVF